MLPVSFESECMNKMEACLTSVKLSTFAQLLNEEQLQAVLGLVEQKNIVAVLPTGFAKILI